MPARSTTLNRKDYSNLARVHVQRGAEWGSAMGTDYWLVMNSGHDIAGAASTATTDELAEAGWTATSLVNTAGAGGDFASITDPGAPNHLLTNLSGDLLNSPAIFGDYPHMRAAADIFGRQALPDQLIAEFWGAMTVHSADEVLSGWGFLEDGGSAATENTQIAWISSDGANFQIAGNAATPINGAADDANWHRFKIVLDRNTGLVTWAIDGAAQTMSTTLAVTADEAPFKFGFGALTTNRPGLGPVHIYYDYN